MINLITGVPGSGKSAYALTLMLKEIEQGRPLFVHGIPNLKIPHTMVVCGSLTCEVCPQPPVQPVAPVEIAHDSPDFLQKQFLVDERNYQKSLYVYHQEQIKFDNLLKANDWHHGRQMVLYYFMMKFKMFIDRAQVLQKYRLVFRLLRLIGIKV